jgi:hypothetical protein
VGPARNTRSELGQATIFRWITHKFGYGPVYYKLRMPAGILPCPRAGRTFRQKAWRYLAASLTAPEFVNTLRIAVSRLQFILFSLQPPLDLAASPPTPIANS